MKKALKFLLIFFVCCLAHSFGMESPKYKDEAIGPSGLSSKKPKNKVQIPLLRERFSESKDINYEGLEKYIHYIFKDKQLLLDALSPLLPQHLQSNLKKFNHLDFLGDSVLDLVIGEKLIALLPESSRGDIAELRKLMVQNRTLTDIYLRNLEIEQYLPFPGEEKRCLVCDVVESLIGAIYLDDPINGFTNSKGFISYILNDHILKEKIDEYSLIKGAKVTLEKPLCQEEIIGKICTFERLESKSPKTLLNEILMRLWNDRPTYTVSMKEKEGAACFLATVLGSQIGRAIQGEGETIKESEEDAAREAINFLAGRELLPKKAIKISHKNYRSRLIDYFSISGKIWNFENVTSPIKVQVRFKDKIIGEGIGSSMEEAEGVANEKAFHYIEEPSFLDENKKPKLKSYRVLLAEFFSRAQQDDSDFIITGPSENNYVCEVKFEGISIGNGIGTSKMEAKEQASKEAFLFLRTEKLMSFSLPLQLFLMLEGLQDGESFTYQQIFKVQVKLKDEDIILGEGEGKTVDEAKKQAARSTYEQIIKKDKEKIDFQEKQKEMLLQHSNSKSAGKEKELAVKSEIECPEEQKKALASQPKSKGKKPQKPKPNRNQNSSGQSFSDPKKS